MSVSVPNSKLERLGLTKRHEALLFDSVLEMYVKARLTNPLSASNPDPDSRPFKWTHTLAEYVADVEHATEAALKGSAAEQAVWHELSIRVANAMGATGLSGSTMIPLQDASTVTRKCARIYHARGLEPKSYFVRVKQRAEDRS